ncbi:CAP domain-containing protein [Lentibacillus sp. Marseille-P4043]|uniref:CAP domain-containing protein n=1 Tax=Lentibacillus sp. Marseille-P4043 TaxID=2040293 RepID=UPI000D0B8BCF|nr:CAP domain-containing protein [Lentibacillus sp. Marseille-P4043]
MRLIKIIVFLFLVVVVIGGYYLLEKNDISSDKAIDDSGNVLKEKENMLESKSVPEKKSPKIKLKGELFQWIGNSSDELRDSLGDPFRIDQSAYGYSWWVYTDQRDQYIQFGVQEDKIKTIYATGNNLSTAPIQIGQSYDSINDHFSFERDVTYTKGVASYTFHLNEDDVKMRPLVKIADNVFVQCYFDTFTNKLSSIRVLTTDILLKHQPYKIEYRGDLPEQPNLTDKDWEKIESGMEQQIFDITNVIRNHFDKKQVQWNETVSDVAFLHSEDMAENNYFSHYSKNGNGLKERLADKNVYYFSAGENIAAQYPDAAAAMEGWLNSEGHREALLNKDYTHLGVGVYHFYYTQNFIKKP